MTFEELKQANELIKTTDIKGKDYAEVNQRIKAFRSVYPEGSIQTEIISLEDGICTMKATIFDREMNVLSTGHAQEKEGSTFINKTSFIENCETSAVGRALGMVGIGIDTSVASFEEVATAIANQSAKQGAKAACKRCGTDIVDSFGKDGELWEASNIIEYSKKRFKKALCPDCQKKELKDTVKAEDKRHTDDENAG